MLSQRMQRRMAVLLAYVLAFVLVPLASTSQATVYAATDQIVYGDRLAAGWSDWSWSSNVDVAHTATVYRGSQAIAWRATAAWGGLYLHTATAVPTTNTTKLQFAVRASQANQQLSVSIYGTNNRVLGT